MCSSDLAMNVTSAPAPAGVDEAAVAGLEMVPSRLVRPPRAKASPVHLECRYLQTVDLPSAVTGTRNAVEIGRASCRETVCQVGEISVCAVSLKKTTQQKGDIENTRHTTTVTKQQ